MHFLEFLFLWVAWDASAFGICACDNHFIASPIKMFLSILTFMIKSLRFYFPCPSWILEINLFKQKQNSKTLGEITLPSGAGSGGCVSAVGWKHTLPRTGWGWAASTFRGETCASSSWGWTGPRADLQRLCLSLQRRGGTRYFVKKPCSNFKYHICDPPLWCHEGLCLLTKCFIAKLSRFFP